MLLSDGGITRQIRAGLVGVDPFDPDLVQPASLDVRLGSQFRVFTSHRYAAIDPQADHPGLTSLVQAGGDEPFILHPGEFALGATAETIRLPANIAAQLAGKSTLGRYGLLLHCTAGWIDPGFEGEVTLELTNGGPLPILLRPGMRIGQLAFWQTAAPATRPYGHPELSSRYQGQSGPTEPRRRGALSP